VTMNEFIASRAVFLSYEMKMNSNLE